MVASQGRITLWLERDPAAVLNAYPVGSAFVADFCMYGYRRPFTAAPYDGRLVDSTDIQLKTAFVVSQILGYTVSKYLGIKLVSEARGGQRFGMIMGLIAFAEVSLLRFAIVPLE